MATVTEQEELDRLIAQQAADDAARRLPYWDSTTQASQLDTPTGADWSFDQFADPRDDSLEPLERLILSEGSPWEQARVSGLIGTGIVWTAAVVAYDASDPCPACEGLEFRGSRSSCLVCSRSADQPKRHPMAGTPTRPARTRSGKPLAGGTGKVKAAKSSKSKTAARRRGNPWADYVPAAW